MGTHSKAGFTIIETILVLGVTGLLVMGIFVGVGMQINVQRYRDSVESLKSLFQEQYSELVNVRNDRDDSWSCDTAGQTSNATPEVKGQSDCVLIGRLVTIEEKDVKTYTVVGHPVASPTSTGDDITSLTVNYNLNVSTVRVDEDELEWSSVIARPIAGPGVTGPSTPRSLSVLFIRSPDSGQIYTFSSNDVAMTQGPISLQSIIAAGQGEQIICVNASTPFVNDELSVYKAPNASVPGAFEIRSNDYWENEAGSTVRC